MSNHFEEITIEAPAPKPGPRMSFRRGLGICCLIKEDRSYVLVGEDPESVTDEELWDMAEGIEPEGWTRVE